MTLFTLRLELENINKHILSNIKERRKVASEIQELKKRDGSGRFDPDREASLFRSMREDLEGLTLKELFAFSLLMEDQAGEGYPQWSSNCHLQNPKKADLGINPLLLLLFHPDKINVDALKDEYKHLANFGLTRP